MASSIDETTIDGNYPVAGQDNDSQGFRDNFTNARNNFAFAKSEIEALQVNGAVLNASNDFSGNIIEDGELRDMSKTVFDKGTTTGAVTFDHTQGHVQTVTSSGAITFAFTGYPATGKYGSILVILTLASAAHTILFPGAVTEPVDFIMTADGAATYHYEFVSTDGGASYTMFDRTRSYGQNGNINITGNTISTSNTNGDIILDPNGTGNVRLNLTTQSTVGSAGGASALPATPTGYVPIDINGTTVILPYYDAA